MVLVRAGIRRPAQAMPAARGEERERARDTCINNKRAIGDRPMY